MIEIKYTAMINGSIRDQNGKLVGFFDRVTGDLFIDGVKESFRAADDEHAFDLFNKYYQQ